MFGSSNDPRIRLVTHPPTNLRPLYKQFKFIVFCFTLFPLPTPASLPSPRPSPARRDFRGMQKPRARPEGLRRVLPESVVRTLEHNRSKRDQIRTRKKTWLKPKLSNSVGALLRPVWVIRPPIIPSPHFRLHLAYTCTGCTRRWKRETMLMIMLMKQMTSITMRMIIMNNE